MTEPVETLNLRTEQLRGDLADLGRLADSFGTRLVNAFAAAAIHGRKLSDVLRGLALSLAQTALTQALRPLGSLLAGRITPFAAGGIVNSPLLFSAGGGMGLAGEAGPEAILPLSRGSDGKLGVRGQGGGITVNVTIATPDVEGFRRSQSQIAATLARAVARGQRNL
jgi:hypothetical protein